MGVVDLCGGRNVKDGTAPTLPTKSPVCPSDTDGPGVVIEKSIRDWHSCLEQSSFDPGLHSLAKLATLRCTRIAQTWLILFHSSYGNNLQLVQHPIPARHCCLLSKVANARSTAKGERGKLQRAYVAKTA